jgi:hypothetical protein
MANVAKWTFLVYLAGDNSLSDAGDIDLAEMREVGSTADVNVIAQFDNEGNQGTNRYHIKKGGDDLVRKMGETDSGSPEALNDFISWSVDSYPADHYALILWNHGGGWEPGEMDRIAKSVKAKGYSVREAGLVAGSSIKKNLFTTSIRKIFAENSPRARVICCDDGSGHSLDTVELGKVLQKTRKKIGKSLDILGMDACLMSNFEVAYQAAPYADYIVSSEETEPNEGWPYNAILNTIVKSPAVKSGDLSAKIVGSYIDSYKKMSQTDVTQSAFNLSKTEVVAKSVDGLAAALLDHMPDAAPEILKAQSKSVNFCDYTLWDINHFVKELKKQTGDAAVKSAATEVEKVVKSGKQNFVVSKGHLGSVYAKCGGSSIYLIPPPGSISRYYADLEFAKKFRNWPKMLDQYHRSS